MNWGIPKKVFNIGEKNKRTTLSLTDPMFEALNSISKQTNLSVPEIIVEALEQWLGNVKDQYELIAPPINLQSVGNTSTVTVSSTVSKGPLKKTR